MCLYSRDVIPSPAHMPRERTNPLVKVEPPTTKRKVPVIVGKGNWKQNPGFQKVTVLVESHANHLKERQELEEVPSKNWVPHTWLENTAIVGICI